MKLDITLAWIQRYQAAGHSSLDEFEAWYLTESQLAQSFVRLGEEIDLFFSRQEAWAGARKTWGWEMCRRSDCTNRWPHSHSYTSPRSQ
jgi:hypothetical protein